MTPEHEQLLDLLICETRRLGPPTLSRIKEITNRPDIWPEIRHLRDAGFVRQLGKHGPWCPVKTTGSARLVLTLVEVGEDDDDPDEGQVGLAELLVRGALGRR